MYLMVMMKKPRAQTPNVEIMLITLVQTNSFLLLVIDIS